MKKNKNRNSCLALGYRSISSIPRVSYYKQERKIASLRGLIGRRSTSSSNLSTGSSPSDNNNNNNNLKDEEELQTFKSNQLDNSFEDLDSISSSSTSSSLSNNNNNTAAPRYRKGKLITSPQPSTTTSNYNSTGSGGGGGDGGRNSNNNNNNLSSSFNKQTLSSPNNLSSSMSSFSYPAQSPPHSQLLANQAINSYNGDSSPNNNNNNNNSSGNNSNNNSNSNYSTNSNNSKNYSIEIPEINKRPGSSNTTQKQRYNNNSGDDMDSTSPLISPRGSVDSSFVAPIEVDTRTFLQKVKDTLMRRHIYLSRTVNLELEEQTTQYPPNVVRNQKYNVYTFLFVILYEQFKYFFNLYFLIVALSQFIPPLQTGYLFTYISPLAFVLSVTILKEAYDDFQRFRRDKEANSQHYSRLTRNGFVSIPSSDIKVGYFIKVETNQRVPCDMVLLRTTEKNGASFIRTDQLDGETDWKLRRSINITQKLHSDESLLDMRASIYAEQPKKDIYSFIGNFSKHDINETESISVENTLWANTVIASGTVIGCAVYTGRETRCVMNTSIPSTKVGLLDSELNNLSKVLFGLLCILAFVMISLKGFRGLWYIYLFRYILLFSSIIPISMRVNLDLGKTVYSWMMMKDDQIPGTVVRSSTIPEELGRIEYLLTDKTGTLTQNDMVFKKLHLGTISFTKDSLADLENELKSSYQLNRQSTSARKKNISSKVRESITAIALCHNVTPVAESEHDGLEIREEEKKPLSTSMKFNKFFKKGYQRIVDDSGKRKKKDDKEGGGGSDKRPMLLPDNHNDNLDEHVFKNPLDLHEDDDEEGSSGQDGLKRRTAQNYQASSPDEIALVKFTESIGLVLTGRELANITLTNPMGDNETYEVLNIFPFTSETKRMGIIVRDVDGAITFYMKGADAIMAKLVQSNDWLDEECGNMAREGLRTLAFGKRSMTEDEYNQFLHRYNQAKTSISDRAARVQEAIGTIENNLELIALTGVEDKLQPNVKVTLERLRNAAVKVWMLTGDKIETATCIAISTKLVSRTQSLFQISVSDKNRAFEKLTQFSRMRDACLVIDGPSLQLCLDNYRDQFLEISTKAPSVVCCRCSPTQKADIVRLIKEKTKKRTCAIGDGGNDVSMIQAADVGVGIVGKEGKQASLAADFSILQFSYLCRLILWHGRNSYKRSARLSQFVIHRGLIISFIQCVFSAIYYFAALSIYNGMLLVGYATLYTNAPVFSLVLDEDVTEDIAFRYPELYHELQKGRSLSYKTFFIWVLKSAYQGGMIMLLSIILFESSLNNIVSITFTSLILCELLNVATEIHTWHRIIIYFIMGICLEVVFHCTLLDSLAER
ncbi:ATPase [Cavenderia fasciculata]|uniref:Phospholipid-transporting ATPase n=1 Tax=Cavenderia fasciculata TaxID=261658 RepID=F4PWV8_CACFS|nr:ATPase [Cavenderia fasciculata]EGG19761.1 ATPase [Cavenderia fasciculata]|eukprot:XP_004358107.1 ATPase [Cavenderia fasciculata]